MANGFKAVRHLNGNNMSFETDSFIVDDNNPKPIFVGHAVALSSGRVVEHSSALNGPILGVVAACYTSTENRPRTFGQPDAGPYVPMSSRAYVDVYVDPDIVYEVVADSGMVNDDIGQLCDIVASTSGNPKTGISYMAIDTTLLAAQTSGNNQTLPFRAIGLARSERTPIGQGFGSGNATKIEVVINNSVRRPSFPV